MGIRKRQARTFEQSSDTAQKKQLLGSPSKAQGNSLLWLARHKSKTGEAMIGSSAFAAGERLTSDIMLSRMIPSVTMSWSQTQHVDVSRNTSGLNPSEAALAARQRVNRAFGAVGPEFSSVLMDLCGFDKGLEIIETERNWPARSGKLVVRLALDCLARHYGYAETAKGRDNVCSRTWHDSQHL